MRRSQVLAAFAVGVVVVSFLGFVVLDVVPQAAAQQGPTPMARPQAPAGTMAMLDVSYVFKNHTRFKAMMADMQADVDAAEAAVKKEREAIKALADRLEEHRAGSPDYKQLEEDLTKRQADLTVQVQLQKKEFLQREAKIYYTIYQELMQEVEYYAAGNGISMVMRFNGDEVDAARPEDVLRDINKPIVWFPKDRDITPYILQRLNQRAPAPRVGDRSAPARPGVPMGNFK